jgi:hypothetical protein
MTVQGERGAARESEGKCEESGVSEGERVRAWNT